MSTGPLFPSAWESNVATCPDWHVSEWTLWGLEPSLAGRTKAWLDIQAQSARAKVKKNLTDRQTDRHTHCSVYEQQGLPVPSLAVAITCYTLALWNLTDKQTDKHCSVYEQQGLPVSSLAAAITCYTLALWFRMHQAWCSD